MALGLNLIPENNGITRARGERKEGGAKAGTLLEEGIAEEQFTPEAVKTPFGGGGVQTLMQTDTLSEGAAKGRVATCQ